MLKLPIHTMVQIAMVCQATIQSYCETIGDGGVSSWDELNITDQDKLLTKIQLVLDGKTLSDRVEETTKNSLIIAIVETLAPNLCENEQEHKC